MKYRKKPVVIEAIQWDGSYTGTLEVQRVFSDLETSSITYNKDLDHVSEWFIKTLEGSYEVSKDDYVIKGVKGEYYPCKPDIFHMTYEKAED